MSIIATFTVPGEVKGQPRPRAFARKIGNTFTARVYDAGTAEGWKSLIAEAARKHLPTEPPAGPLSLACTFWFARPKSHYRTGRNGNGLKPSAPLHHTHKPDADNCAKAVLDCLTRLRMWYDDTQVVLLVVRKEWAGGGSMPGALIEVREVSERGA